VTEQVSTTATCKYPGCENSPESAGGKPGRPPQYCPDPGHNPVTAWRERKRLADTERGVTSAEAESDQPVTMARVTGAELLRQMGDMAGQLAATAERLTGAVATMSDPTAAEAEVESARAAAEQRAATAEAGRAEAERRAATADQMRAEADAAAEEMSEPGRRAVPGPGGARPADGGDRGARSRAGAHPHRSRDPRHGRRGGTG
jgi:colicin import membrane protein